jgi:5-methylthioadenosine/S-adenosylhomocysteine deaminase
MHGTVKPHYRPEDVYAGNLLGRLEALHSGVTTMLDWFHCRAEPRARRRRRRRAAGRAGTVDLLLRRRVGHPRPVDAEIRRVRSDFPGTAWSPWRWGCAVPEDTGMDTVARS